MCFKLCLLYFSINSVTTVSIHCAATERGAHRTQCGAYDGNNAKSNTVKCVTPNTEHNIGPNIENSLRPNTEKIHT